ncbi:hypothetical protein MVEN_01644700 [Mycena venus]|uniref:Uncharacterized protein n=1 Tax=Mycena venus TaxID=2733690 RepID=A0A8H6XQD6_9AGAR|nr:hypothetical protein MVEN_01644700 [Mycena venus]
MQLHAVIAASLMIVTSAAAASLEAARDAPVSAVAIEEGNRTLSARASGTLTLYTGKSFTGKATPFAADTGTCWLSLPEPYVSHLLSAKVSAGLTCFMFTANGCDNNKCEVCVDDAGYHDMTRIPAVHAFRCQAAGPQKCATATNCNFN